MAFGIGNLIGAGVSLLGSSMSQRQQRGAAQDAIGAAQVPDVFGPLGSFQGGRLALGDTQQSTLDTLRNFQGGQASLLNSLDIPGLEQSQFDRLSQLARPGEAQALSGIRDRLFSQGRLGLGAGGGRLGGQANPELQGFFEAQAQANLLRSLQSQQFARGEQQRLLGNVAGSQNVIGNIGNSLNPLAQIGIGSRTPAGLAAMAAGPGMSAARTTEGFFSTLGQSLGGLGGTFGGGGGGFTSLRSHEGRF